MGLNKNITKKPNNIEFRKSDEIETSSEILKKILTNSRDVIFHISFNPKAQLKFISDSSKNVLGYTAKEIYNDVEILKRNLHAEDRNYFVSSRKEYLKSSKNNKENKINVRFYHKKGKYVCLEILTNPVYDKNKNVIGLIGNIRDVTERNKTQRLLMETKSKFDLITNNGNDIVALYTYLPKDKYLYVSPNIKRILGYEPEQLLNEANFFTDRVIDNKKEFIQREKKIKYSQIKNTKESFCISYQILTKYKKEVWLENSIVPISDPKGKTHFFLNILRDITEQKKAELEVENQYMNYRNLLDNSPQAYFIVEKSRFVYVNKAMVKLVKAKNKNQILEMPPLNFFEPADRKRAQERLKMVYAKGRTKKPGLYKIKNFKGQRIEVETRSVLIRFNNSECVLSTVSNISEQRQIELEKLQAISTETTNKRLQKEIGERQKVEQNLREKTAHLSSILESSRHLIWTVNSRFEITSFNKNFQKVVLDLHGVKVKPFDKIDTLLKRNRNEYINYWYPKYKEAFEGKKLEFEKEEFGSGKPVYRKIFINPIVNDKNVVTEISCIANDITDSKIYEQKLINQTRKLTAIFDSSHHYIWTINKSEKLTSFNKNYFDLVNVIYNTKPYIGLFLDREALSSDKEYVAILNYHYEKAFGGQATSFEVETKDKNNKTLYLEIFLNPIFENNQVIEISGIAHNITDKKLVQQKMETSLNEKEILLREVHHRVKNNMQVISSILNLQSSYVSDEYTLTLLKESQNRITTMAYIHESLYQNKSFTSINFSEYVQTLINNIIQSYSYSEDKIELMLEMEELTLSLDLSIPAGLIINELVTNAIKHAFPSNARGTITFALRCENNLVFLELKDNGVGFAPGSSFENSHSLGLQLVNTLIEQIEGKLYFKSEKDKGTEVVITFKM